MDKIYTNKDFKKKMVESALNGEVKESHDQNGKYFEITNLNDFEYESNGVKRDIYAGAKFRVYNKTEKISLLRGEKTDNKEIEEFIKLPEKDQIPTETLIKEIQQKIRECKDYASEMQVALAENRYNDAREARAKLENGIHKLDELKVQVIARQYEMQPYEAIKTVMEIEATHLLLDRINQIELNKLNDQQIKSIQKHLDSYTFMVKSLTDNKENLSEQELKDLGSQTANAPVNKTTMDAISHSLNKQDETGFKSIVNDYEKPIGDTVADTTIDDVLNSSDNGGYPLTSESVRSAIEEDDREAEKERTLF